MLDDKREALVVKKLEAHLKSNNDDSWQKMAAFMENCQLKFPELDKAKCEDFTASVMTKLFFQDIQNQQLNDRIAEKITQLDELEGYIKTAAICCSSKELKKLVGGEALKKIKKADFYDEKFYGMLVSNVMKKV